MSDIEVDFNAQRKLTLNLAPRFISHENLLIQATFQGFLAKRGSHGQAYSCFRFDLIRLILFILFFLDILNAFIHVFLDKLLVFLRIAL